MTSGRRRFATFVVFVLVLAGSAGWFVHRYIYQTPVEVDMKLSERFFSPDYFIARERFREMVRTVGGRLETIPLDARGPNGESIAVREAQK